MPIRNMINYHGEGDVIFQPMEIILEKEEKEHKKVMSSEVLLWEKHLCRRKGFIKHLCVPRAQTSDLHWTCDPQSIIFGMSLLYQPI